MSMSKRAPEAPLARLALVFHAPTIARVEVVYQPAGGRVLRALTVLVLCWACIPLLAIIPPHYPWAAVAFFAGLYIPFRIWTGRYQVRSFTGFCPRCGRPLHLPVGSKIDLPHTLSCFGCHFDPVLEAAFPARPAPATTPAAADQAVEHRHHECVGQWRLERRGELASLVCTACHARHCATPPALASAEAENRMAGLLDELAGRGRFLF
jgi:hypothetical protein